MPIAKSYYQQCWPRNWYFPKYVALNESSENPFEISDAGDAIGIFQMHWDFIETWADYPNKFTEDDPVYREVVHSSPGVWKRAMRIFLGHHAALKLEPATVLRIFHYGHDDTKDPDGYVVKVLRLAGTDPMTL